MKNKITVSILITIITCILLPAVVFAVPTPVRYDFSVIQTGVPQNVIDAVESQLYVEIDWVNGGSTPKKATFSFYNDNNDPGTPNQYFVATQIYFMDPPPILAPDSFEARNDLGSGTEYTAMIPGNPNLPAGNTVGFEATGGVYPVPPPPENGIGPGDKAVIHADFAPDLTTPDPGDYYGFNDLKNALDSGLLDIGLHVQAFDIPGFVGQSLSVHLNGNGNGGPDPGPTPIPEPATMLLFGTGLAGIAGTVRRRKKIAT